MSSARNLGLDKAEGEYITFVDADDWVDPDYLETLCPKNGEDLVCCSSRNFPQILEDDPLADSADASEALRENLIKSDFSVPFCKAYKSAIINGRHLRFNEELSFSEDTLFNLDYWGCGLKSVKLQSCKKYNYARNSAWSLSKKRHPAKYYYLLMDYAYTRLGRLSRIYGFDGEFAYKYFIRNWWRHLVCRGSYLRQRLTAIATLRNYHVSKLLTDKVFMGGTHICRIATALYALTGKPKKSLRRIEQ